MLTRTAIRISSLVLMMFAAVATLMVGGTTSAVAAPQGAATWSLRAQNVDWMTGDQAAALDLSFPVLVPTWIPAPFGGSPAIEGGGGYYSLYWVNLGGAPTFLQITGEVGGSLPAGSPADLNVQLSVNASVQGYDAIHDVTGIYDNVWWIAGDVLYRVSSNNMTGTDSLSLANSLITLEAPVAEEPAPTEPPVDESSSTVINNNPDSSGQSLEEVDGDTDTAPESTEEPTRESTQEPDAGDEDDIAPTAEAESNVPATPSSGPSTSSAGAVNSPNSTSTGSLSDGTAGPTLPIGGDGTGGIFQVAIP